MELLQKHNYNFLESIRLINFRGQAVDHETRERDLGSIELPSGQSLESVLDELADKELILKFQFVDEELIVLNDRICLERVLNQYIAKNEQDLKTLPSTTTNEIQKQRYSLKSTVLNQIKNVLKEKFEKSKEPVIENDERIFHIYRKIINPILKKVKENTEKFLKNYKYKSLTNSNTIEKEIHFKDVGDYESIPYIVESLKKLNYLFAVNYDGKTWYLAEEVMKKTLDEFKEKMTAEKIQEHNNFFTSAYDSLKNVLNLDQASETEKKPSDKTENDTIQTEKNEEQTSQADPKRAEVSQETATSDTETNQEIPQDFENLKISELVEQVVKFMNFESTKKLLKEYYQGIESAQNAEEKKINYKTFFGCLSMMIRIPGTYNKQIYEIAKLLVNKLSYHDFSEELAVEIIESLENSYRIFEFSL